METKINQETLFNPTFSREINTLNLEHNKPLVEHTLGRSHDILSSSKNESISDPGSISTTQLFTKPMVVESNVTWSVDQNVNTVIYAKPLLDIFQQLEQSPGGQALRANTFFRSGARIQVKLTSSPFHAGKLVLFYTPPGVRSFFRESIYARIQFPSVYIDAGNSTTGELDIPFVAIKDFFATHNPDPYSDYGNIGIAVLNRLAIGTGGQTSVTCAVSIHPTQNQIALPVLAHDIVLQAGLIPLAIEMIPEILESSVGIGTAAVTSAAVGAGATALVGDMVNQDTTRELRNAQNDLNKPMNTNNTSSSKDLNISAPSLSNMVGYGTEHLSLLPEVTYVRHPSSHNPIDDEMDLQKIAQVPSLLSIREWSSTDEPNTILFKSNIDPMVVPTTVTNNEVFTIYPTYLAHVTNPFAFWRGSIDFHFSFASTEQHKGKIIAAWIPFDLTRDSISAILPNPTVATLSLFPNEIFDLSLNSEFSFSVPYNTETPYRATSSTYSRLSEATELFLDNVNQLSSLGTIYLAVYNKLSHPISVTPTIQFNTFIKAGRDYQIRSLRYNQTEADSYEKIRYITLQGLEIAMESSREGIMKMPENRVGMNNSQIADTSFQFDDSEHHLGKLLSKYYPQIGYSFTLDAATTRKVRIANLPGIVHRAPRAATEADPRWRNLINHFRDIYAFWTGSINYFFIHNSTVNNPVLLMASHNPFSSLGTNILVPSGQENQLNDTYTTIETFSTVSTNTDLSETCVYSHMSNLRVNPTIEVTTPYRSIFRRLYTIDNRRTENDPADIDEASGTLDLVYSNPSVTDIPVSASIFQSLGSDFRFKYLIPPPSLRTRAV